MDDLKVESGAAPTKPISDAPRMEVKEWAIATLRYYARRAVYSSALSAALIRTAAPVLTNPERPQSSDYATGNRARYFQRTFSITARDALTARLVAHAAETPRRVWDIGCGRGSLAASLRDVGCTRYQGTDINAFAISTAREEHERHGNRHPEQVAFLEGSMGSCEPCFDGPVDVVVFNEVLYYLATIRDVSDEIARVARWLSPRGIICISLKDDPKSHAILRSVRKTYRYIHSVLYQEQVGYPSFRVRINRQRPAYLIAVIAMR